MQDHVTHLEILREEIDLVTNRKNDLEKKVHQLIAERENLSSALDESADKMLMLEKHTREQDCQVRMTSWIDTDQDFLIKLGIKPLLCIHWK